MGRFPCRAQSGPKFQLMDNYFDFKIHLEWNSHGSCSVQRHIFWLACGMQRQIDKSHSEWFLGVGPEPGVSHYLHSWLNAMFFVHCVSTWCSWSRRQSKTTQFQVWLVSKIVCCDTLTRHCVIYIYIYIMCTRKTGLLTEWGFQDDGLPELKDTLINWLFTWIKKFTYVCWIHTELHCN